MVKLFLVLIYRGEKGGGLCYLGVCRRANICLRQTF